ncbi:hypothetical protein CSKR_111775 [Clonorchis sinensis]|uniref:Eukaryotictranslation initiation factor n=2 Tax=Clonorchis sinensis TaxID=79923 RepID=G7YD20_CLOSI|nr:hypothetical protein CSKR_111775 [Clonorchis sinensis]GAA50854.1 eukaryotictranslation initiation factor [Clonorchis sinensis]
MEADTAEFKNYKNLKNLYKLFCVGCVVFLIGFFFIFFGRPYTFDRTNKDLFLPFGLLFLIPGIAVIIGASYLLSKQWKLSNDFAQLNKMQPPVGEMPDEMKGPIDVSSPVESLPGYSQLGLDPNEPI